jgi:uncharacterized lipoprotein YmbA
VNSWRQITLRFGALSLVFALGACASPEPHLYVLSGGAAKQTNQASDRTEISLGIGPVELPDYLDRRELVTRSSENELNISDFAHWAEPLKFNIPQSLVEEIAELLPSQKVVAYPWKRANPVHYQVTVKIIRFETVEGGNTVLRVRWSLLSGDGKADLLTRDSEYTDSPKGKGYEAIVASMNADLLALARDITIATKQEATKARPIP